MSSPHPQPPSPSPGSVHHNQSSAAALKFYQDASVALLQDGVPFLVGGGYALHAYCGIDRKTKDFDIFAREDDLARVLDVFTAAGYETERTHPAWLAKARSDGGDFIDVIFNAGNGCCPVDESWFDHAAEAEVLGLQLKVCPLEETIWQKSYIFERDRCDVTDVVHLLRCGAASLDWRRLLDRFGNHWRLLLAQLIIFGFVYPAERGSIPAWVMQHLTRQLEEEPELPEAAKVCCGPYISRDQFQFDLEHWGYQDGRSVSAKSPHPRAPGESPASNR